MAEGYCPAAGESLRMPSESEFYWPDDTDEGICLYGSNQSQPHFETTLKLLKDDIETLKQKINFLEEKDKSNVQTGEATEQSRFSPNNCQELHKLKCQRDEEQNRARQLELKVENFKKEQIFKEVRERELIVQAETMQEQARRDRDTLALKLTEQQLALEEKKRELDKVRGENTKNINLIEELQRRLSLYEQKSDNCKMTTKDVIQKTCFDMFEVEKVNDDSQVMERNLSKFKLKCDSCGELYTMERNSERVCHFHPLPPMKFKNWEKWLEVTNKKKYQKYGYWFCCNTLAKRRPVGCFLSRHHQSWESDILIKAALDIQDPNFKQMLDLTTSKVQIIE